MNFMNFISIIYIIICSSVPVPASKENPEGPEAEAEAANSRSFGGTVPGSI